MRRISLPSFSIAALLALATPALAQNAGGSGYRGPTRVDFDDRLIKGQTTKADSVYIYDRQTIEIRSLVMKARTFRPKIIRAVFEE
jgi:hypothetical protein